MIYWVVENSVSSIKVPYPTVMFVLLGCFRAHIPYQETGWSHYHHWMLAVSSHCAYDGRHTMHGSKPLDPIMRAHSNITTIYCNGNQSHTYQLLLQLATSPKLSTTTTVWTIIFMGFKFSWMLWVFLSTKWTLFIIRLRLLFYFVFRTRSICFHNIYRLQMALGV